MATLAVAVVDHGAIGAAPAAAEAYGIVLLALPLPQAVRSFVVLPWRWVVA